MQRALHSAIGLPRRLTNALWILVFLMPADVRRNFMLVSFPIYGEPKGSVTYWREGRSKAISTEYFEPGKLPDCPQGVRPVLACQLFAVLGGFVISTYSLRSSSSSVGLWKNSIQVILLSSVL